MSSHAQRVGLIIWKLRGKLLLLPFVLALFITYREIENDLVVFGLGGTVFGLGLALRVWSQMHLHFRLRMAMELTTTGPYAFVRNPIYLGNVLMACGVCIGCELLWMVPLVVAYCAALYTAVVRYEEASLIERYGSPYTDYLQRVPRWFPRLAPERAPAGGVALRFLGASLRIEALTLLYWLPVVLKELASGRVA